MPHIATHSRRPSSRCSGQPDHLSADPEALFVYGSLRFPDVLNALLGRLPDRTPATATGWRVAALPGRLYPGLVTAQGSVTGLLLTDLTHDEWHIIDTFEDDAYDLRQLTLTDGRHASTYVYADPAETLLEDWDLKQFEAQHLSGYVQHCLTWRRGYLPSQ